MNFAEIKKLFDAFGAPLDREDVWSVQSATVIKHKALEKLAACARIGFEKPQVLRAERDEAVILVHGNMCAADNKNGGVTRHEWSIGEALVNVNYRVTGKMAAYVYAMAEKRAKDRVILKLAGLNGLYSEDEADEFKEQNSAPQQGRNAPASSNRTSGDAGAPSLSATATRFMEAADLSQTKEEVTSWVFGNTAEIDKLPPHESTAIKQHARALYSKLPAAKLEAAE